MRVLIVLIPFVVIFLIGLGVGRWTAPDRSSTREYRRMQRHVVAADTLIDDLTIMASEHRQFDEVFAVLAMDKIIEYRRERNQSQ